MRLACSSTGGSKAAPPCLPQGLHPLLRNQGLQPPKHAPPSCSATTFPPRAVTTHTASPLLSAASSTRGFLGRPQPHSPPDASSSHSTSPWYAARNQRNIHRRRMTVKASAKKEFKDAGQDRNAPTQSNSSGTLSSQTDAFVSYVEAVRKYFRTVYDFPEWEKHRKLSRLVDSLVSIPRSHILEMIRPSLIWVMTVSTLLVAFQAVVACGVLPSWLPSFVANPSAQAFINNTSTALSLLLVFRTNTSYGRWDEARKMWGVLVNRSRDIMRQACVLFPTNDLEAKKALARWTVAFARAMRIHFQPEVTLEDELRDILKPAELRILKASAHRPVQALNAMSQVLQNTAVNPVGLMQLNAHITLFQDVLGGCERLLRSPIPVHYTRHTGRFLFVWLTVLPFALFPTLGPWTIPCAVSVTAVLCGIEEIGVQCEEPFGILPLDVICNRIQADVMNTLGDELELRRVVAEGMGLQSDGRISSGWNTEPWGVVAEGSKRGAMGSN